MEVVMPAITALSYSAAAPLGRLFGRILGRALIGFGRPLARWLRHLDRAIKHRRAAQALARFDDRMLADIGLTRADLRDAYAESLWGDPTMRLRARALERRLARHGISHGLAPESALAPPLAPKVDAATLAQARVTFCGCS
jgi:uncharacterized protein YjiS (DUF1127 family)